VYKEASEFIKAAEHCGIDPHEASIYYYFIDELEKCGSVTEFEKIALLAKFMATLSTKMPKTFAAATGASSQVSNAMVTNPLFNQSMMSGDVLGMGLSAGAGALKGLANLYKKTPKKGIPLKKTSKLLEGAAPVSTATNLSNASGAVSTSGDLVDLFQNSMGLIL
jgi:hypothetical protein